MNERGISIVGTVFTMIILGIMGATLVSLVATDQESRTRVLHRELAFYAAQAGFEYALREIREGGYPIVSNKQLGNARFTTTINETTRTVTSSGVIVGNVKSYSITAPQLAKDCVTIDMSAAVAGGGNLNQLQNVRLMRTCLSAVSIDRMTVVWTPDLGEKITKVQIDGVEVFNDLNGVPSGQSIDIMDYKFSGTANIDKIEFSSSISGKRVTVSFQFTDSSTLASVEKQL